MYLSLTVPLNNSMLEVLRQRLVQQNQHNGRTAYLKEFSPLGIVEIMRPKLARRGITPNENNVIFAGTLGVEEDVLEYAYRCGICHLKFRVLWNYEEDGIEFGITSVEHYTLRFGVVAKQGERYLV